MKAFAPFAILIGLGMGLAAGIGFLQSLPPPRSAGTLPPPTPRAPAAPASPGAPAEAAEASSWQSIDSEDPKELIANLREAGCPEQTLRDIVRARIDALFAEREGTQRFVHPEASKPWGSRAPL